MVTGEEKEEKAAEAFVEERACKSWLVRRGFRIGSELARWGVLRLLLLRFSLIDKERDVGLLLVSVDSRLKIN